MVTGIGISGTSYHHKVTMDPDSHIFAAMISATNLCGVKNLEV